MRYREQDLLKLFEAIKDEVSEKRYRHILGVECCAVKIASVFSDVLSEEDVFFVSAAALLHDVTKDKGQEWQKEFIREKAIDIPKGDEDAKELWHSFTAPAYISIKYPNFSDIRVLSAVYNHSTGDECMSLIDKIICLADYIEDGRQYKSCIDVRNRFFEFDFASSDREERIKHLDRCLLLSFEYINEHLKNCGEKISDKTQKAMKALQKEINSTEVS